MKTDKRVSICNDQYFDRVYQEQVDSLYRFIYYKCGSKSQAEDIVQEAFLKLWENCAKVAVEKVSGFLFTTSKNIFINKINRQKVEMRFESQIMQKAEKENPEYIFQQKEFEKQLHQAISQLPEHQRIVFLMNRIDQLKYREIAEKLEISQKAVEKRMHNALLTLRKLHKKI